MNTRHFERPWRALNSALAIHLPPIAILGIYLVAYLTLLGEDFKEFKTGPVPILHSLVVVAYVFLIFSAALGLVTLAVIKDRKRAVVNIFRWLVGRNWAEIFFLRLPFAVVLMPTITFFHLSFKINIAYFSPYSWDIFFSEVDRFLFFGYDPWMITHWLMPGVTATQIIDTIYKFWFLAIKLAVFSVALLPLRHPLRLTFLTAYGLNWLLGGALMAILFASGGPVYMERLTGDPTFAPLMERLYEQGKIVPLMALEAQEWLWNGFTMPDVAPYGISAFPSLHVTIATTCACLGFAVNRALGWTLAIFAVGIFLGSIHLAWHYAVDGIAGAFLAVGCWYASRRVTEWWLAFTERRGAGLSGEAPVAAE